LNKGQVDFRTQISSSESNTLREGVEWSELPTPVHRPLHLTRVNVSQIYNRRWPLVSGSQVADSLLGDLDMRRFDTGDTVRIDIPDETDPDHTQFHGSRGTIVEILSDDAGMLTGDDREQYIFRVELTNGKSIDVRWRDLRPL
jgi:ribosomal protein L21E